jgi:rhamnulokinase
MVSIAETSTPFELLINPDDPTLVAPDDMVDAINALAMKTGQSATEEPGVLYRAALEGLALRYRACLGMLESLVENQIEQIHIVGGGSLNELLCQMTADACNRTVIAGPVEATAIGNLLMQMMGTGEIADVAEARRLVRNSFETKVYQPQNHVFWESAASDFAKL